jgi:cell fate regulator YaaT (PSP1 superfamily)
MNGGDGRDGSSPARAGHTVGVKLHPRGRMLACDAGGLELRVGDEVVVAVQDPRDDGREDGRETDVGVVAVVGGARPANGPLPRVLRRADDRDRERQQATARQAAEALAFARERARARALPIKVFRAELQRGGRALFYFASETRIDFRELVRDLGERLRARIELRQVGARDEAKMVGGIGSCGRELCCSTFLPKFAPVSIKMAKHQNLALNPAKVSGQCGRLKCCLVYEDAIYVEAAATLPKLGKRVETPEGIGRVGDLDVLHGRVRVYFDDHPPKVFTADQVAVAPAPPPPPPHAPPNPRNQH